MEALSIDPMRTATLRNAKSFAAHWDEIAGLRRDLGMEDDALLDPLHFLTTLDATRRSCSVACWRGREFIGLVYLTERHVWGMGTGYAIGGDFCGRGLLLCRAEDEAAVIKAAIEEVVAGGVHSLHLRMSPRDARKTVVDEMEMKYLDALIPGDRLALQPDMPSFLAGLGRRTRRNVRYYMRKSQAAGIVFDPSLTMKEYEEAVKRLNAGTDFPAQRLRLKRDERLLTLHGSGQRMGLRGADGTLVSVLCGFRRGRRFHLLTQLNASSLDHLSLSTVLRGHAIEHLIDSGQTELQFVGGTSLSFGRFCAPQLYRSIFVDRTKGASASIKRLSGALLKGAARLGQPAPELLKLICNGRLEEWRLTERTAVGPAAVLRAQGQGLSANTAH